MYTLFYYIVNSNAEQSKETDKHQSIRSVGV